MKARFFVSPVLLSVVLFLSCCSSESIILDVFSKDSTAPVFLECRAVSSTEIAFKFTRPVRLVSLYFDTSAEVLAHDDGEVILVTLAEPLNIGVRVTADILVEDENKNTLNVLVPFRARNDRVPKLVINEIRTEGSNVNNAATARVEFVEFIVKSAGNLGALRFFCAGNSIAKPVYEFPPVEVLAGEYIVLHLRTPSPDNADETGIDLTVSAGNESHPAARDLWVPGSVKTLHKDDIVYVLDQDDMILDIVFLSTSAGSIWSKPAFTEIALLAANQGAWFPAGGGDLTPGTYTIGPNDAVQSTNTTNTRSISRDDTQDKSGCADYWYITANSSATPGFLNNPKRYIP